MAGAIFIPSFYIHHIFTFLNLCIQKKKALIVVYSLAVIFSIINFTPFFVKSVEQKLWFKYWPNAGLLYGPFLIIWFLTL